MMRPKSDYTKVKMNYSIVAPRMYNNKIDSLVLKGDYLIVEDSDDKQKDLISFLNTTANKYLADQHYLDLFGRNGTSAINSIFRVF